MTFKAIDSKIYGANLRSEPSFGNNIVGYVNQCEAVEVIGPKQGDRWMPCKVDGHPDNVFISENVLRNLVSEPRERLARECVKQWLRFDKETGKEHENPYYRYIGEYWRSVYLDHLDGTDRNFPWAGPFVSFCVQAAGGYDGFRYAAAASKYVHQAIRSRLDNENGPFWGFKVTEHKPQIGDMVCSRRGSEKINYEEAAQSNAFGSHCDIVISVRDDHVSTIGGNIKNTVSRVNFHTNSEGYLQEANRLICVMRNNL
ncbi:MAG: SH3 domain-containing C40 family peptidase [Pseudomonadota bacterium]